MKLIEATIQDVPMLLEIEKTTEGLKIYSGYFNEEEVKGYDLKPKAIIEFLKLRDPQFRETAKYGHFGNNFNWDN